MMRGALLGLSLALVWGGVARATTCFFDDVTPESLARNVPTVVRGIAIDRTDEYGETIPAEVFSEGYFVFEVTEVLKGQVPNLIRIPGTVQSTAPVYFLLGEEYTVPLMHRDDDIYAERHCDEYYLNHPDHHEPTIALLRQHRDEIAEMELAIILDPDQPEVLQRLSSSLVEFMEAERALPYLDRLVDLDPDNLDYHAFRSETIRRVATALLRDDYGSLYRERVLALLNHLIAVGGPDVDALVQRAHLLAGMRRDEAALTDYRAVLAIEPDDPAARHGATLMLVRLGRAGEIDPDERDFSDLILTTNGSREGPWADFSGANLAGASFRGAHMRGSDFSGANLQSADLRFNSASGANFSDADLSGAQLGGSLDGAVFDGANLRAIRLEQVTLKRTSFVGAILPGIDLRTFDLTEADFRDADLSGADFGEASLHQASLIGADLSGSNLSGAYLFTADLTGANLRGARYDCATEWPEGLEPIARGAISLDPACEPISDEVLRRTIGVVGGDLQPAPVASCLSEPTVACLTQLILVASMPGEPGDPLVVHAGDAGALALAARNLFDVGQLEAAGTVALRITRIWDPDGTGRFSKDMVTPSLILAEVQAAQGDIPGAEAALSAIAADIRAGDLSNQWIAEHVLRASLLQEVAASWIRLGNANMAQHLVDEFFPTLLSAIPPVLSTGGNSAYVERMPLYDLRDIALLRTEQGDVEAVLRLAERIQAIADSYRLEPGPSGMRSDIARTYMSVMARTADLRADAGDPAGAEAIRDRTQQVLDTFLPGEMNIRDLTSSWPTDRVRGFPALDRAFERDGAFLGDCGGRETCIAFVADVRAGIAAGDIAGSRAALLQAASAVAAAADPCAALLENPLTVVAYLQATIGDYDGALASVSQLRQLRCSFHVGTWVAELVRAHGILAGVLANAGRVNDAWAQLVHAKFLAHSLDRGDRVMTYADIAVQQARLGDVEGATVTLHGALQDILARPGSTRRNGPGCCHFDYDDIGELVVAAAHAGQYDLAERIAGVLVTWPDASFSEHDVRSAAEASIADIAVALVEAGSVDEGVTLAEGLPAGSQARALVRLALPLIKAGQAAEAAPIVAQARYLIPDVFATLDNAHGSAGRAIWLLHAINLATVDDGLGRHTESASLMARASDELRRISGEQLRAEATIALAEAEVDSGAPGPAFATLTVIARRLHNWHSDTTREYYLRMTNLGRRAGDQAAAHKIIESLVSSYKSAYATETNPAFDDRIELLAAMLPIVAAMEAPDP